MVSHLSRTRITSRSLTSLMSPSEIDLFIFLTAFITLLNMPFFFCDDILSYKNSSATEHMVCSFLSPSTYLITSSMMAFAFLFVFVFSTSRYATSYILYILRTRSSSVFADLPRAVSSFDDLIFPSCQQDSGRLIPVVL